MRTIKKTSVQISKNLHDILKSFCDDNGYKLSGVVEKGIKMFISGSKDFEKEQKEKKLLLD